MSDQNKKISLIVILSIVAVLILIGGYYIWDEYVENDQIFTTPTQTEHYDNIGYYEDEYGYNANLNTASTNWIDYDNTYFNYSLSYPTNFTLSDRCYDSLSGTYREYTESPKWLVILDRNMEKEYPYCDAGFTQMDLIIKSFYQEIDILERMEQSDTDIEDEIKIGNYTWARQIETTLSEYDDTYHTNLYLNINGRGYEISIRNYDSQGSHDAIIEEIISTITFK
jgi:hypothetical protein